MRNNFIVTLLSAILIGQNVQSLDVEGISSIHIQDIFIDQNGVYWMGTDQGLNRFDGLGNDVFRSNPFNSSALSGNRVWFVDEYRTDSLIVVTDQAIHIYGKNDYRFTRFEIGSRPVNYFKSADAVWITTRSSGIYKLDKHNKLHHFKFDPLDPFSISTSNFKSIDGQKLSQDFNGNMWLATDKGLSFISGKNNSVRRYYKSNTQGKLLSDNINSVYVAGNTLWIGTDKGLNYLAIESNDFLIEQALVGQPIINIQNTENGVLIFCANDIYIKNEKGLKHFKSKMAVSQAVENSGKVLYWKSGAKSLHFNNRKIFVGSEVYAVDISKNDDFILATSQGMKIISSKALLASPSNIRVKKQNNLVFKPFYLDERYTQIQSQFDPRKLDAFIYTDNHFWFVKNGKAGRYNFSDKSTEQFDYNARNPNTFPESISSLAYFNNDLWIGSDETGLYRFQLNDLALVNHYQFDINKPKSLQTSIVNDIQIGPKKQLWIASGGDGLFAYDSSIDGFNQHKVKNGLSSDMVRQLFVFGEMLFVHNRLGLNYLKNNQTNFSLIDEEDGLAILNYDYLKFYHSGKSLLILDGNKQFAIKASGLQMADPIFSPHIKTIVGYDAKNDETFLPFVNQKVNVPPSITSMVIHISVPSLYKAKQGRYNYQFGSSSNAPLITKKAGEHISVPKRGYGNKTLILSALGVDNAPIELAFNYIPPWYFSWWAIVIYIGGSIGLIYFFTSSRAKKIQQRMEQARKGEELEAARDLQLQLLAKKVPDMENIEVETFIRTATEVGGDYYDFFELPDGTLIAACGDATGHGTTSGMMVSITKAGLKGIEKRSPNQMLSDLNNIVKSVDIGRLRMSLNLMEFKNGHVNISSAAMPPVYHYSKKTDSVNEIELVGTPLGSFYDEEFDHCQIEFEHGDALVMMSDGLPEAPNPEGEMLDYPAVMNCIKENGSKSASELKDTLINLGDKWMDGVQNPDDITLVIFKKKDIKEVAQA